VRWPEIDQDDVGKVLIGLDVQSDGLGELIVTSNHFVAAFAQENYAGLGQEAWGKVLDYGVGNVRTRPDFHAPGLAVRKSHHHAAFRGDHTAAQDGNAVHRAGGKIRLLPSPNGGFEGIPVQIGIEQGGAIRG
jgi:hypothetical protein